MEIIDQIEQIASAKAKALTITRSIKDAHLALFASLEQSIGLVWDAEDPQAVVNELGNQAAAVFGASRAATICLESISKGCTAGVLAKVGTFTINADGSITDVKKP